MLEDSKVNNEEIQLIFSKTIEVYADKSPNDLLYLTVPNHEKIENIDY